jgi:hypothetical protein
MKKKLILSLIVGIVVGIGAAKLYIVALNAGHAAYLFPDYGVGIIFGCLSAILTFKLLKKK